MSSRRKDIKFHILSLTTYSILSLIIFRLWILSPEKTVINGDLSWPVNLNIFFHYFYPLWNDHRSLSQFFTIPSLPIVLPFFGIGFLLGLDSYNIILFLSVFATIFAGLSMYFSSIYLLKKYYKDDFNIYIASILSGIFYLWNPYIVTEVLHPLIRFTYAIIPLMLVSLIKGLEERKIKHIILSSLLWSIISADLHNVIFGAILLIIYTVYITMLSILTLNIRKEKNN